MVMAGAESGLAANPTRATSAPSISVSAMTRRSGSLGAGGTSLPGMVVSIRPAAKAIRGFSTTDAAVQSVVRKRAPPPSFPGVYLRSSVVHSPVVAIAVATSGFFQRNLLASTSWGKQWAAMSSLMLAATPGRLVARHPIIARAARAGAPRPVVATNRRAVSGLRIPRHLARAGQVPMTIFRTAAV